MGPWRSRWCLDVLVCESAMRLMVFDVEAREVLAASRRQPHMLHQGPHWPGPPVTLNLGDDVGDASQQATTKLPRTEA